jgi:hypothetical protein
MPALGVTIDEAVIAAELERLDLADFCRAYLNLWPGDVPSGWHVTAEAVWRALAAPDGEGMVGRLALAADTTPERAWSSIAAAGRRVDGKSHVEVIAHDRGTAWVVPRLVALVGRHHPCAVVVDATGPAGSLIPPLEAAGIEVTKPSAGDAARAAGAIYDEATNEGLRYAPNPALDAAVAGVEWRQLGDARAWSRRSSSTVISPWVACTLAAWGHATRAHLGPPVPSLYV